MYLPFECRITGITTDSLLFESMKFSSILNHAMSVVVLIVFVVMIMQHGHALKNTTISSL